MPAPTVFNAPTGQMVHAAAITDPTGGATVDTQVRAAIVSLLAVLRSAAIIAGGTVSPPLTHTFNGPTAQIVLAAAIADASGGGTIDTQARTSTNSLLAVMRAAGLIAGGTVDPSIGPLVLDEDYGGQLANGAAIADASGGATIDAQARTAINSALAACRLYSLIAVD